MKRKLKQLSRRQFFFISVLVSILEFINDTRVRIFIVIGFLSTFLEIVISGADGFTLVVVVSYTEAIILERVAREYVRRIGTKDR